MLVCERHLKQYCDVTRDPKRPHLVLDLLHIFSVARNLITLLIQALDVSENSPRCRTS